MLALAERYQCYKLKKMCLGLVGSCGNTRAVMGTNDLETLARSSPCVVKDVINEILDARVARRRRLITVCIFVFFFWSSISLVFLDAFFLF
jgi:speckle-type POZ protein